MEEKHRAAAVQVETKTFLKNGEFSFHSKAIKNLIEKAAETRGHLGTGRADFYVEAARLPGNFLVCQHNYI